MTNPCEEDKFTFPKTLKAKHLKSLESVYLECIAEQCYLPVLITSANQLQVFGSGIYCAEVLLKMEDYCFGAFPQHCRQNISWNRDLSHTNMLDSGLHITYPLAKRPWNCHNISPITTTLCTPGLVQPLYHNIDLLPLARKEDSAEEIRTVINDDLQAYLRYMKCGGRLQDQIDGLQKDAIVAVAPDLGEGRLPWFGRVIQIDSVAEEILIRWFHKGVSSNVYMFKEEEEPVWIHFETVICNGVYFEPTGESVGKMWKLITPMQFIREMNVHKFDMIQADSCTMKTRIKNVDILGMHFNNSTELESFLENIPSFQ